jgi:prepilin-type N-terminal cleavage/methylation domain-containing protein
MPGTSIARLEGAMKDPLLRMRHSPLQRGFTLLELLVVVGIITIMLGVTIPFVWSWLRTNSLRAGQQEIAGELQAARGQAIKRNVNAGVVFVLRSDNTYQYIVQDDPLDPAVPSENQNPTIADINAPTATAIQGRVRTLPNGVEFVVASSNGDCALRFDSLGRMCRPDAATAPPCPDVAPGAVCSATNYISYPSPVGSVAQITLRQRTTGVTRDVTIEAGGRVRVQAR